MILCLFFRVNCVFFFFKQKTAYEMRISDWSSTCAFRSARDLADRFSRFGQIGGMIFSAPGEIVGGLTNFARSCANAIGCARDRQHRFMELTHRLVEILLRSEEHTSELQSLMRISYAVFCLKKQTINHNQRTKK